MPVAAVTRMRKGEWLMRGHMAAGYEKHQAFTFTSPRWVFGSAGPLAAWCQQFPHGANMRERDVYQFGVYTGGTMAGQVLYFRELAVQYGTHWGFDSFVGLPPEASGHKLLTRNWQEGAYSAADAMRTWKWQNMEQRLKKHINRSAAEGRVEFLRGFFNETLTPTLAAEKRMQPALYVDMDGDLYVSSIQALEWLFCSGLIAAGARNGTVVRYDDWGGPTKRNQLIAERRAHLEITNTHRVRWAHAALLSNWFRAESYELNRPHCAARGYAPVAEAAASLGRGAETTSMPPTTPSELAACAERIDIWRRPFVSRGGVKARCTEKYLTFLASEYAWALRPTSETFTPTPAEVDSGREKARLLICGMHELLQEPVAAAAAAATKAVEVQGKRGGKRNGQSPTSE